MKFHSITLSSLNLIKPVTALQNMYTATINKTLLIYEATVALRSLLLHTDNSLNYFNVPPT